jgi:hypothetical protein
MTNPKAFPPRCAGIVRAHDCDYGRNRSACVEIAEWIATKVSRLFHTTAPTVKHGHDDSLPKWESSQRHSCGFALVSKGCDIRSNQGIVTMSERCVVPARPPWPMSFM